ncbi:MAG: hypothetical protein QW343_00085 [Candidatus Norongarragalinales archaeon]
MKKDVFAIAILALVLLLAGCTQQQAPAAPNEAPSVLPSAAPSFAAVAASPSPSPSPSPTSESKLVPLKLEYEFSNKLGEENFLINVQYFFEEEKKCGNKRALLGLLRAADESKPEAVSWAKTTLYLDDGVLVPSQQMSETDLAFDNAKPHAGDWDLAFFLNALFASVGQDLVASDVWTNKEEPTILKSARISKEAPSDASVMKKGAGSGGAEPCVEFTVISKTAGEWTVCVKQPTDENPLAYVVYANAKTPSLNWRLKKASKQKSGVMRTLQCLEPIKCPFVQMPSGDERRACEQQGNALIDERDEKGCVTRYACIPLGIKVKVYSKSGPIAGVEVAVLKQGTEGKRPFLETTDARGEAFFKVGPGEYEIGFTTDKFPAQYEIPPKTIIRYPGGIATHEVQVTEKQ